MIFKSLLRDHSACARTQPPVHQPGTRRDSLSQRGDTQAGGATTVEGAGKGTARGWQERNPGEAGLDAPGGPAVRGDPCRSALYVPTRCARRAAQVRAPATPGSPVAGPTPTPLGLAQVPARRAQSLSEEQISRPSVPPCAASAKAANQLCLRRSAGLVPTSGGMWVLLRGVRGERPGPRGPHPPGALAPPRHVPGLGASHRDGGARKRWPLAVYKSARHLRFLPFSHHFWSPA